jgi:cyclic nucleotide gated channel
MVRERARLEWAENKKARSNCLESADNYNYGAYKWTVQLVANDSRLEKILFPIFWGLMTLRYTVSIHIYHLFFFFFFFF